MDSVVIMPQDYSGNSPKNPPARCERDHLELARLIVLAPNSGVDLAALARRVWALAAPCRIPVLFLSLEGRAGREEPGARLRLITLASMTRDEDVEVETRIERGSNWVLAVQRVAQPGDLVICHALQTVRVRGCGHQPLSQVLETVLTIPVYVLAGLYREQPPLLERHAALAGFVGRAARFFALAIPLLVIAVFFYLQMRVELTTGGIARTTLLLAAGLAELGVIGAWSVWVG